MNEIIGIDRGYIGDEFVDNQDDTTITNVISKYVSRKYPDLSDIMIEVIGRTKFSDFSDQAILSLDKETFIRIQVEAFIDIYRQLPEKDKKIICSLEEFKELAEFKAEMTYENRKLYQEVQGKLRPEEKTKIDNIISEEYDLYLTSKKHFGELTRNYIAMGIPITYCDHISMELSEYAYLKDHIMPSENNKWDMLQKDFEKAEAINSIYSSNRPQVALAEAVNAAYIKSKNKDSLCTLFFFGKKMRHKYRDSEKTEQIFSRADNIITIGFNFDNSRELMQKYKNIESIERMYCSGFR